MSYSNAEGIQQVLDTVAEATDELGVALACLGEAYEQLDEASADRLEEALFRPVQSAYGRAQRVYSEFAERRGVAARGFEPAHPPLRERDARHILELAVAAVEQADLLISALQDSMLPIEVGDPPLRGGLEQVRVLLGETRSRAREITRSLGR